ncbi:MAG: RNA methyltransferase [Blautia sp.]|nr:RNA methyltransferase [Blautia sp.]
MITSSNNAQVKNIIQLNQKGKARREQGLFSAEGRKMFREAPLDWIEKVYVSESFWNLEAKKDGQILDLRKSGGQMQTEADHTLEDIRNKIHQCSYEIVDDKVFRQMSDTQTPQGILTILRTPSYQLEEVLRGAVEKKTYRECPERMEDGAEDISTGEQIDEPPLVMILEDLQDPGNAGTIIRTGEGAGVQCVILTKTCVDVTNPKVIRSTMGSIYRIPFVYVEDVASVKEQLKKYGIRMYAAHLEGENPYYQEDYRGGTAFLIGNEGKGLTEEAAKLADRLIRIPMQGQVESLNAAMAAGILLYEAARQRFIESAANH